MSYLKKQDTEKVVQSKVKSVSADKQTIAIVKSKVSIPQYFYTIIVPQLGNYYDTYPVDFDAKPVVCCPLHDEDTPSCRYYENTSSFYCFGCGKGGDIISLHRYFAERMNGTKPSYADAVNFLYNYFVKGKETESFIENEAPKTLIKSATRENEDKDIIKLNIYRKNIEKSITIDNNVSSQAKRKIWRALDTVDCLIDKKMVIASDAEDYLKKVISEALKEDNKPKIIYKGIEIK